jgi:lysophospholipid acyltransferase (LPLAT)-like uncharacterized protein
MKIRHPWLIKALGFVVAWVVRLWICTLRYRYRPLGPSVEPRDWKPGEHYLFAFWHENMLLLAHHYARPDIRVLISQHADGQLIAEACRHLGFGLVRGSTTRGGVEAVRQMLRLGHSTHLAITPDGPRGPRRRVQPGVIYLAARTGMPIVPIGIGFQRPWRMRSWDRFVLPRPWSRAACVTGVPIHIPPDADKDQLEPHRLRLEQAMSEAGDLAEHWADQGKWPEMAETHWRQAS